MSHIAKPRLYLKLRKYTVTFTVKAQCFSSLWLLSHCEFNNVNIFLLARGFWNF